MRALPDGGEAPYELNTTYFDALREPFGGPDGHHIARFLCSQTIVMSLEGVPAFYIHSLLATPNDHDSVEKRGMNRAINRHRWNYDLLQEHLADPKSQHAIVLNQLRERLKLRRRQVAFHPNATQFTLQSVDSRVMGVWRQSLDRKQSIFALHNVSAETVTLPAEALNLIADEDWTDILAPADVIADDIVLAPYQCRWITNLSY